MTAWLPWQVFTAFLVNNTTYNARGQTLTASYANGVTSSLTDAVMAGLAATVPGRVHLVGHSLGGSIALEIAKRVPAKIASLALFAPAGLGTGINRAFTDAFTQLRDAASAETILRKLVVRHRLINQHMISRVLAHLQKSQRRETLGLIAVHLRSIEGPVADAVAAVVRSAIPTMTIWGALDQINPPDRRRLNALGGEQHFLTEAGHLPQIEDYNTCNGLLQTFLEKHSQHTVAT